MKSPTSVITSEAKSNYSEPLRIESLQQEHQPSKKRGLKDQEKFWLIENQHLSSIIQEQALEIKALKQTIDELSVNNNRVEEVRKNNQKLIEQIAKSQEKGLEIVTWNEQLSKQVVVLGRQCASQMQEIENSQILNKELKNEKYVLQKEIERLTDLLLAISQQSQTSKKLNRSTTSLKLSQFKHKLDNVLEQNRHRAAGAISRHNKTMVLQSSLKKHEIQINLLTDQRLCLTNEMVSLKLDLEKSNDQIKQLNNKIKNLTHLCDGYEHKLKLKQLEDKLKEVPEHHENQQKIIQDSLINMSQRQVYEAKLQSKKELIKLLNKKMNRLEEELLAMTQKYENLQAELFAKVL